MKEVGDPEQSARLEARVTEAETGETNKRHTNAVSLIRKKE